MNYKVITQNIFWDELQKLGTNTAAPYEHKSQHSEEVTLPPCAKGLEQRQGLSMSKS